MKGEGMCYNQLYCLMCPLGIEEVLGDYAIWGRGAGGLGLFVPCLGLPGINLVSLNHLVTKLGHTTSYLFINHYPCYSTPQFNSAPLMKDYYSPHMITYMECLAKIND